MYITFTGTAHSGKTTQILKMLILDMYKRNDTVCLYTEGRSMDVLNYMLRLVPEMVAGGKEDIEEVENLLRFNFAHGHLRIIESLSTNMEFPAGYSVYAICTPIFRHVDGPTVDEFMGYVKRLSNEDYITIYHEVNTYAERASRQAS